MNQGKYLQTDDGQAERNEAVQRWHAWWPYLANIEAYTGLYPESEWYMQFDSMEVFVMWFTVWGGDGGKDETYTMLKDLVEHSAMDFGPIHLHGSLYQDAANEMIEEMAESVGKNMLDGLAQIFGDRVNSLASLDEWVGYVAIEQAASDLYERINEGAQ